MAENVRTPQQSRSIEKKNRIITAGYKLFAEKGYYNTNTAEIAKEAGVSTGIVYGYFHDKRDILIDVLDIYIDQVFRPVFDVFEEFTPPLDIDRMASQAIDGVVKTHKENAAIHEALHSLTHTDEAIRLKFVYLEDQMTQKLAEKLVFCGLPTSGLNEKVHLSIKIVESFAHECVYDKHEYLDYDLMRSYVIKTLRSLLS